MNKIRTIAAAFEEIKAADPGTSITLRAIRAAVTEGEIPSKKIGTKYLISMENVISYFSGNLKDGDQL